MRSVIEELVSYQDFPVISVIAGLGEDLRENEIKLRGVLAHAFDLTPKMLLKVDRDIFFARLEFMLSEMSSQAHPKGVALFIGKDFVRIVPLNYFAQDRIVIESTGAIAEVVYSSRMFPYFNVIVLSGRGARVYKICGESMVETKKCQLVDHVSRLLKNRIDGSNAAHCDDGKNDVSKGVSTQKLHHAFLALLKNLDFPAIVFGSDLIAPLCPEMAKYMSGFAEGDFEYVSNAEIGRAASEMADAWVKGKVQQALSSIVNFEYCQKLAFGFDEVITQLQRCRVENLYLEELSNLSNEVCDSHKLSPADKLISAALKSGADVFFLPQDNLSKFEGVAGGLR